MIRVKFRNYMSSKVGGEALEFYKQEHKNFTIMYHFIMPEVLPF